MTSVAAIVVTYNRQECLGRCLAALAQLDRPVDRLILVDNASTDTTAAWIEASGLREQPKVDYLRLDKNIGGAGGFSEGLQRAMAQGHDWLWLLDDDTYPRPGSLSALLAESGQERVLALSPKVLFPSNVEQPNWSRFDPDRLRKDFVLSSEPARFATINSATFNGLLLSRRAVEQAGYPLRSFFIWFDDIEYCLRLAGFGEIRAVPASVITHDADGAGDRMPAAAYWKVFYGIRNSAYFVNYTAGESRFLVYYIYRTLRQMLGVLLWDDHKTARLKILATGLHAGLDYLRRRRYGLCTEEPFI